MSRKPRVVSRAKQGNAKSPNPGTCLRQQSQMGASHRAFILLQDWTLTSRTLWGIGLSRLCCLWSVLSLGPHSLPGDRLSGNTDLPVWKTMRGQMPSHLLYFYRQSPTFRKYKLTLAMEH